MLCALCAHTLRRSVGLSVKTSFEKQKLSASLDLEHNFWNKEFASKPPFFLHSQLALVACRLGGLLCFASAEFLEAFWIWISLRLRTRRCAQKPCDSHLGGFTSHLFHFSSKPPRAAAVPSATGSCLLLPTQGLCLRYAHIPCSPREQCHAVLSEDRILKVLPSL